MRKAKLIITGEIMIEYIPLRMRLVRGRISFLTALAFFFKFVY